MSDGITLYTSKTCGPCRRLKRRLDEAGIAFEELDINTQPAAARRIEQMTGGYRIVPTVEVGERLLVNPDLNEILGVVAAS